MTLPPFFVAGKTMEMLFFTKNLKKVEKIENLSKIDLKKSIFSTYFSIFRKSELGIVFSTSKTVVGTLSRKEFDFERNR